MTGNNIIQGDNVFNDPECAKDRERKGESVNFTRIEWVENCIKFKSNCMNEWVGQMCASE